MTSKEKGKKEKKDGKEEGRVSLVGCLKSNGGDTHTPYAAFLTESMPTSPR